MCDVSVVCPGGGDIVKYEVICLGCYNRHNISRYERSGTVRCPHCGEFGRCIKTGEVFIDGRCD